MLHRLTSYGRANPVRLSILTATGKTAAADILTQRCIEGSETLDLRRVALFSLFGFYYLGAFQ